jgi:predicted TIM-barrel fold metal-dependent hydrolase
VRDPEMLIHVANDVFLDDKRFWPIFEHAQALDVPLYLHPSVPLPAVMDAYYKDYAKDFPMVVRAAWGYTVETATQAIRLVLGGVFDAYPRLKVALGHLGGDAAVPGVARRSGARPGAKTVSFHEAFCGHFYIARRWHSAKNLIMRATLSRNVSDMLPRSLASHVARLEAKRPAAER